MKSFFLKDIETNIIKSWENLINDINETKIFNPYCKSSDYYTIFKSIIISILIDEKIILLDSDFSDEELINLVGTSSFDKFYINLDFRMLNLCIDKEKLIKRLLENKEKWSLTLFTSGTTGLPKKVVHNFSSITRFVKVSQNHMLDIWGFAYNPTHMAGLQVFFQALLNGNSIVRLFGLNNNLIHEEIISNEVTNISATPTFYKLLLTNNIVFNSVKRITSGGEKFNKVLEDKIKNVFPNAKITNVYASTEAGSLFASENDIFTIRPEYFNLVKIENDELLIHASLIGGVDVIIDEWYNTGDIVYVMDRNPLKFHFVSRKTDVINVGGYKVNPIEVEEVILSIEGVKDVRVFSKNNSVIGNIICCELVCHNNELTETYIRTFLKSKIQEFKIPRVIKFVEELSITRSGKINRRKI